MNLRLGPPNEDFSGRRDEKILGFKEVLGASRTSRHGARRAKKVLGLEYTVFFVVCESWLENLSPKNLKENLL